MNKPDAGACIEPRRRHCSAAVLVVVLLVVLVLGAGCSGGSDAGGDRDRLTPSTALVPAGEPAGTVPTVVEPELSEKNAESVEKVVERLDLDAEVAACLLIRVDADPKVLGNGNDDADQVAAGCTHLVERIVPVYVESLESDRDLGDETRGCLAVGLYRLTDEQVDAISASMVGTGGEGAEGARRLLFDMQKGCGLK